MYTTIEAAASTFETCRETETKESELVMFMMDDLSPKRMLGVHHYISRGGHRSLGRAIIFFPLPWLSNGAPLMSMCPIIDVDKDIPLLSLNSRHFIFQPQGNQHVGKSTEKTKAGLLWARTVPCLSLFF